MKYRKKPVVVEAIQFVYTKDGIDTLRKFGGAAIGNVGKDRTPTAKGYAEIGTLEDGEHPDFKVVHIATEGDYIIRGVKGEYYACKPDIFLETYEPVSDTGQKTTAPFTPFTPYVVDKVTTTWAANTCSKCGIKLEGVMGYCCPHPKCPTGLGGGWSSSETML